MGYIFWWRIFICNLFELVIKAWKTKKKFWFNLVYIQQYFKPLTNFNINKLKKRISFVFVLWQVFLLHYSFYPIEYRIVCVPWYIVRIVAILLCQIRILGISLFSLLCYYLQWKDEKTGKYYLWPKSLYPFIRILLLRNASRKYCANNNNKQEWNQYFELVFENQLHL